MRRTITILLLLCMLILPYAETASAAKASISKSGPYDFSRERIGFEVSDTCSGHVCFAQVSVREDGWFATYTNFTKTDDPLKDSPFGRVYVDIFNEEGILQKEITFQYGNSIGIILLEETVEIYMDTMLLSYNWERDELEMYVIPSHSLSKSGLYLELHASKFQVGEWTYKCKRRSIEGYALLTRENGETTQTLLSYAGTGFQVGEWILPFVPTVSLIILATVFIPTIIKKRKT